MLKETIRIFSLVLVLLLLLLLFEKLALQLRYTSFSHQNWLVVFTATRHSFPQLPPSLSPNQELTLMNQIKVGFLGAGVMSSALINGLLKSNSIPCSRIIASDPIAASR